MENQTFDPNLDIAHATQSLNDADCTININNVGPINNYHAPSASNIQDAINAVNQLTIDDIWRLPPFRITVGTIRLEAVEVTADGGRNWQILINDINGPSTISSVIVQENLGTASTVERRAYVQKMVRAALAQSWNLAGIMDVNGPCR
jgi:hypothetical protein